MMTPKIIRPQKGPQEKFLSSNADIVVYGGAAGGGKTYSLLMEPLRYMNVRGYRAVIFRKNYNQISSAGGLWDESLSLYTGIKGAIPSKALNTTGLFPERPVWILIIFGERKMYTVGKDHR